MYGYFLVSCVIILDIVTGVVKGLYQGKIDSTILRTGLFRKLSELLAVVAADLFDSSGFYPDLPIFDVVIFYILMTEFISILENIGEVNPNIKNYLKKYLNKMK